MKDNLGNGSATQDRFTGQLGYHTGRPVEALADSGPARNGAASELADVPPRPSLADLDALSEPVFPTAWLDGAPGGTLADHPLLRGLLLELPPKGTTPAPGWLDRWFEAARSILELLYLQDTARR